MLFALMRNPQDGLLLSGREDELIICARILEYQLTMQVAPDYDITPSEVTWYDDANDWVQNAPHAFPILICDKPDVPGAGGYHIPNAAKVFWSVAQQSGSDILSGPYSLSKLICHEGIEARLNLATNLYADFGTYLTPREACDAVQGDSFEVHLDDGTTGQGSNYVLPEWFDKDASVGPWFDKLNLLNAPGEMTPHGYQYRLDKSTGIEAPIFGANVPDWHKAHIGAHGRIARAKLRP